MSPPTDSPRDELRALRARAYGPDADIQDDPDALARLLELETRHAAGPVAGVDAHAVVAVTDEQEKDAVVPASPPARPRLRPRPGTRSTPAQETTGSGVGPAGAAEPDVTAPDGADPGGDGIPTDPAEPRRPWWRRRIPVLWAGIAAAVALVLGAGLTLWTQSLDAGRIAVLHEDPDADWPTEIWGGPTEGSLAFESFHGLRVLSQPQPGQGDAATTVPCIIVFSERNGVIAYASGTCGAGAFPATATMLVDRSAPADLRDTFPEGTSLQFVLDGDQVHVYAKGPDPVVHTP